MDIIRQTFNAWDIESKHYSKLDQHHGKGGTIMMTLKEEKIVGGSWDFTFGFRIDEKLKRK